MQMFVKRNDKIDVTVFVWETSDGNIDAAADKTQVPEKTEDLETITFTFRRPTYQDSTGIMREANIRGETEVDFASFQDVVLRTLLVDWSIADEQGKNIPVRAANISNLQPAIARAATVGCLEKITLF